MDHDGYYHDGTYGMNGMDGGGWMIALGVISVVLLLVAVVVVVVNLYFHLSHRASLLKPDKPASEARPILDQRLARGEISAEEYSSVRAILDGLEG